MNNHMFFVKKVNFNLPRNKAQEEAIEKIKELEYHLIDGPKGLEKFESHMNSILDDAHSKFHNCRPMKIEKTVMVDGTRNYNFCVKDSAYSGFGVVDVCYVRGVFKIM